MQTQESNKLLNAIEAKNITQVRQELERETSEDVSTNPSLDEAHGSRTPLMAAARHGHSPIFTTLLRRFERRFSKKEDKKCWQIEDDEDCPQTKMDAEMKTQLRFRDEDGMSLAMLAARCGTVAILRIVTAEIIHTRAWQVFKDYDNKGHTLLMHAASAGSALVFRLVHQAMASVFSDSGDLGSESMARHWTMRSEDGRTILMHAARSGDPMALTEVVEACQRACTPRTVRRALYQTDAQGLNFLMHSVKVPTKEHDPPKGDTEAGSIDFAVPVFSVAIALVTECLWKGQRREQLTATDLWGQTVLTHAIRSGHSELFDAVLKAVRRDFLDSEVEQMVDTSEDKVKNMPLRSALPKGDTNLKKLYEKRVHELKVDIGLRAKLVSVEAKIQSFIPGKLIVVFQLMLPETNRGSRQLLLLIIMCVAAPVFNWAGALVTSERPTAEDPRSACRKTWVSFLLGAPALFFWGVGITSSIGDAIGWDESLSAALLAVATIVIPAVDVFLNSQRVEQWYEKCSCQKQLFVVKAESEWRRKKKRMSPFERKGGLLPVRHEMAHVLRHSDSVV